MYRSTDLVLEARSDETGTIVLEPDSIPGWSERSMTALVGASGYSTLSIDRLASGNQYVATLEKCTAIEVLAMHTSGTPLANVRVLAFTSAIAAEAFDSGAASDIVTPFRDASCFAVAVTGPDGVARFDLPERTWNLYAHADFLAMTHAAGTFRPSSLPDHRVTLEMGDIWGAICEFVEPNGVPLRVLGWTSRQDLAGARPVRNVYAARQQTATQQRVLAELGSQKGETHRIVVCTTFAGLPGQATAPAPRLTASVTVLLEGAGTMVTEVELRPLREHPVRRIVADVARRSIGTLVIDTDADCRPIVDLGIAVATMTGDAARTPRFRVQSGVPTRVPTGKYAIVRMADNTVLQEVEVASGAPCHAHLPRNILGCHLHLTAAYSDGRLVSGYKVTITPTDDASRAETLAPTGSTLTTTLPAGQYDLVVASGNATKTFRGVQLTPGLEAIRCVIDL